MGIVIESNGNFPTMTLEEVSRRKRESVRFIDSFLREIQVDMARACRDTGTTQFGHSDGWLTISVIGNGDFLAYYTSIALKEPRLSLRMNSDVEPHISQSVEFMALSDGESGSETYTVSEWQSEDKARNAARYDTKWLLGHSLRHLEEISAYLSVFAAEARKRLLVQAIGSEAMEGSLNLPGMPSV